MHKYTKPIDREEDTSKLPSLGSGFCRERTEYLLNVLSRSMYRNRGPQLKTSKSKTQNRPWPWSATVVVVLVSSWDFGPDLYQLISPNQGTNTPKRIISISNALHQKLTTVPAFQYFPIPLSRTLPSYWAMSEFDPKNMLFRRLGPSGLRVPVFSLGGCMFLNVTEWRISIWWNICLHRADTGSNGYGRSCQGDLLFQVQSLPRDTDDGLQEIIKTAFDAGINMFDTAEAYAAGKSEQEM